MRPISGRRLDAADSARRFIRAVFEDADALPTAPSGAWKKRAAFAKKWWVR